MNSQAGPSMGGLDLLAQCAHAASSGSSYLQGRMFRGLWWASDPVAVPVSLYVAQVGQQLGLALTGQEGQQVRQFGDGAHLHA